MNVYTSMAHYDLKVSHVPQLGREPTVKCVTLLPRAKAAPFPLRLIPVIIRLNCVPSVKDDASCSPSDVAPFGSFCEHGFLCCALRREHRPVGT